MVVEMGFEPTLKWFWVICLLPLGYSTTKNHSVVKDPFNRQSILYTKNIYCKLTFSHKILFSVKKSSISSNSTKVVTSTNKVKKTGGTKKSKVIGKK